jgi:hypothetical protein
LPRSTKSGKRPGSRSAGKPSPLRAGTKKKQAGASPSAIAERDVASARARRKTSVRAKTRHRESAARTQTLLLSPDESLSPPRLDAAILEKLSERLTTALRDLVLTMKELPRAADFQPLADHLYEFARAAPELLDALRSLRPLIASLERAAAPLQEAVEDLLSTQASLSDALFHLPRPTEYEPLAEPMREFARRSPPLLEALEAMPRTVALLENRLRSLEQSLESGASIRRVALELNDAGVGASYERLRSVKDAVREAHTALQIALDSLPREPDYAPVARQLKELASVSPSLLEWLSEIPRLSMPLADSIRRLREAASLLAAASELLAITIDGRSED